MVDNRQLLVTSNILLEGILTEFCRGKLVLWNEMSSNQRENFGNRSRHGIKPPQPDTKYSLSNEKHQTTVNPHCRAASHIFPSTNYNGGKMVASVSTATKRDAALSQTSSRSIGDPLNDGIKLQVGRKTNSNSQNAEGTVGNIYSRHTSNRRVISAKPRGKNSRVKNNSSMSMGRGRLQSEGIRMQETATRSFSPAKHYTIRPVIPAAQAELLSVARAMNREEFAPRLKRLFNPEREAALEAIESGLYIGWRCPEYKHDCIRVGSNSKCFCGHLLNLHVKASPTSNHGCGFGKCLCKQFAFIPSRPEDVGEWWLPKRPDFDVTKWRAKCRCKHTHESHDPNGRRQCRIKGCSCFTFDSNFLCCACDRHWEEHETFFDSADSRKTKGLPYGEYYLPFHELPDLRNIVLTGEEDDNSKYDALTSGPYAIPRINQTPLAKQLQDKRY